MIELIYNGVKLRQYEQHRVTYLTFTDGSRTEVIGPRLCKENISAIILAAGNSERKT
jgi:hypothetical protein